MFILNFRVPFRPVPFFVQQPVFIPRPFFVPQPVFVPQPLFAQQQFFNPGFAFAGGGPMAPQMAPPILAPGVIPQFPQGLADPLPRPACLEGLGAVGGAGAPPAPVNLPVPGNITIPAGATLAALRGGRVVQYRDGGGTGPHRIGVRPAAGGAIQWFDIDDARLGLDAATQTRISSSALLAQQLHVTVRPDGTCIEFRAGGQPPVIYDANANGELVSRAVAGRPSLVYRHNPGGSPNTFVETNAAGVPAAGGGEFRPITVVAAGSPLAAAGIPVGRLCYVSNGGATNHTVRMYNPDTNAWATPPMPGTAVNAMFENGTLRYNIGGAARHGDSVFRMPDGNLFILNQNGTRFRIVTPTGAAVGPDAWTLIAGHANQATYNTYAAAITASRNARGYAPAADAVAIR